jgi:hypothetical protein
MIAGVLCQRKSIPSIYALDANFNVFPFVDDAGHFTVNNNGGVTLVSNSAQFDLATANQTLEFVGNNSLGTDAFNFQQDFMLEFKVSNGNVGAAQTVFDIKDIGDISGTHAQRMRLRCFSDGDTALDYIGSGSAGAINLGTSAGDNRVIRVEFTASTGEVKIYKDGVLGFTSTGNSARASLPRIMTLGGTFDGHNHSGLLFDYVRLTLG